MKLRSDLKMFSPIVDESYERSWDGKVSMYIRLDVLSHGADWRDHVLDPFLFPYLSCL
jgi:hypothetical protein